MQGFDTDRPCDVCGQVDGNKLDTWFNYVACKDHYDVSPVEAQRLND